VLNVRLGPNELFSVELYQDLVAFRTEHGTYIGLGKRGHLVCVSQEGVGNGELFMLQIQVAHTFSLVGEFFYKILSPSGKFESRQWVVRVVRQTQLT